MLYWGIFTTGYIVGVMFTLYIFIRKKPINNSTGQENIDKIAQNMVQKPSKIFARLTQINYLSKKKGYSLNVFIEKIKFLLTRRKLSTN